MEEKYTIVSSDSCKICAFQSEFWVKIKFLLIKFINRIFLENERMKVFERDMFLFFFWSNAVNNVGVMYDYPEEFAKGILI